MTSELFSTKRTESLRANQLWTELHHFAAHPDINSMLKHFGFRDPVTVKANPEDKTAWTLRQMSRFMSTNPLLNPRGGKERSQATPIQLTENDRQSILDTAQSLGMIKETRPLKKNYDGLIALGAGGAHAYERVAYLKETEVTGNTIYCVAGDMKYGTAPVAEMQKMPPKEDPDSEQRRQAYIAKMLSLKERYNDQIPEFEFMLAAAETTYGARQPDGSYSLGHDVTIRQEDGNNIVKYLATENHPEIVIVEAHNKLNPNNRARSEDTLEALFSELQKRNQRDVLISTNAIFKPFQHIAAKRILTLPHDHDIAVETVGFAMEKTPSFNKPERYIQEITAAVIENHRLADALLRPTRHFRSGL